MLPLRDIVLSFSYAAISEWVTEYWVLEYKNTEILPLRDIVLSFSSAAISEWVTEYWVLEY